jgi:hypothetical protein
LTRGLERAAAGPRYTYATEINLLETYTVPQQKMTYQIVPAQPGFLTIYDFPETREVMLLDPVVAWRIETHPGGRGDELITACYPITVEGDLGDNCIGVQNPNNTVTTFQSSFSQSLAELQAERYPLE